MLLIPFQFSTFDTEAGFDKLKVYNGPLPTSPLLAVFSGTSVPGDLWTTSDTVLVTFTSDHGVQGSGFTFNWTTGTNISVHTFRYCTPSFKPSLMYDTFPIYNACFLAGI